jgi:hypothetical protein
VRLSLWNTEILTLTLTAEKPDFYVERAGHYRDASLVTEASEKKPEVLKSPKKKIFGMSLPSFGKSTTTLQAPLPPPMPSKAAEVLGTKARPPVSPTTGRRSHPRPWRPVPRPPRSDTSKSLPTALYEPPSHHRRPNQHGSLQSRNRTPVRRTHSRKTTPQASPKKNRETTNEAVSPGQGPPPTPPKKDTPPDSKDKASSGNEQGLAEPTELKVKVPNFLTSAKPVASDGGKSPTKFCPFSAEDYAKLVEPQPIASARADMDNAAVELDGDSRYALFKGDNTQQQEKYPQWWREECEKRFKDSNGELPPLEPRFYSPSVYQASLFDGTRPSQNVSHVGLQGPFLAKPSLLPLHLQMHPNCTAPSHHSPSPSPLLHSLRQ